MNGLILYTTEDGRSQIKLWAKDQTVWLSQREMAQLFDVSTDNVGLHLKNIFEDRELEANSVTEESSVTAADGKTTSPSSTTSMPFWPWVTGCARLVACSSAAGLPPSLRNT